MFVIFGRVRSLSVIVSTRTGSVCNDLQWWLITSANNQAVHEQVDRYLCKSRYPV